MIFRKRIKDLNFRLGILVALLAFGLYANTIRNGFVYDDNASITKNSLVKQGVHAISTLFKTSYWLGFWGEKMEDEQYRPLPLIVFATLWQFFPNNPMPGHILNVVLYALTGFFLFTLLRKILSKYHIIIPFIAAILFIAHPLHTEVVANIKSADELISFLLVIFTFHLVLNYAESKKMIVKVNNDHISSPLLLPGFYVLLLRPFFSLLFAMVCFFFALLAKESPITMLAVIPMTLYFFKEISLKRITGILILLLIPTAGYLAIRYAVLGGLSGTKQHLIIDNILAEAPDISSRLATVFYILINYIRLIIFPHPLACDYSFKQMQLATWSNPVAIISLLLHIGLFVYAVTGIKKKNIFSYCILFYLITLFLYTNILLVIGNHFAERFLFEPLLGVSIIAAVLLAKAFKIDFKTEQHFTGIAALIKNNRKVFIFLFLLLIPYALKTFARNANWESESSLFGADVKNSPLSARIHFLYADVFYQKAFSAPNDEERNIFLDKTIAECRKAVDLYSSFADAYGEMGYCYFIKGDSVEAFESLTKALEFNSTKELVYSSLGFLYSRAGQPQEALELFQHAVEINPRYAEGWQNVGINYHVLNKDDKAIEAFLTALQIAPDDAKTNNFLAIAYQSTGDTANAKLYFEKAYQLDPSLKK